MSLVIGPRKVSGEAEQAGADVLAYQNVAFVGVQPARH
jgi:hypothetical protein